MVLLRGTIVDIEETVMAKKVAIVMVEDCYYDDYNNLVVKSITDWAEISNEDYMLLKKAEREQSRYRVLEQPLDTGEFIANTVSEYIKKIKEDEEKAAKAKAEREKIAREKALKKLANNAKKERELYEQLKAKLGEK